ncbi:MAG: ATP-binding protein [Chloroflexota bacterium]
MSFPLFSDKKTHPVLWSELAIWPLPKTKDFINQQLHQPSYKNWLVIRQIAANPFQRGHLQHALSNWLLKKQTDLFKLYSIVDSPALDEYLIPPLDVREGHDFDRWLSAKVVLLYELGNQFISGTEDKNERNIWQITQRYRFTDLTPLAQLAALLGELLHKQSRLQEMRSVTLCEKILAPERYEPVRALSQGSEIADSLSTICTALGLQSLTDVANCANTFAWLGHVSPPLLRSTVVEALRGLYDVSEQVAQCRQRTNLRQQTTLLNLVAGRLNELQTYVDEQVPLPERGLLARVVVIWQGIIDEAQGELARDSLQQMSRAEQRELIKTKGTASIWQRPATPFDNPYIAGDPVYRPLFKGRQDIFSRVSEVWGAKSNPDSIILYGHRRMGKSSILRNLEEVAPAGSLIVYADMMGETSFVASTADLLLTLADKIYTAVRQHYPNAPLNEPDETLYSSPSQAQRQFNRLANQVQAILGEETLILTLDEFEAVETAVEEGKIGKEIYQFLRTKTQEKWLTLIFGGLHTLDEMSRDYQQPFYGSYANIRVSYLSHRDAYNLITNPTPDFSLNYEPTAVEKIIHLSGGQPYLIQQLCRDTLNHLNHAIFDNNEQREAVITLADVEAVLGERVFRHGMGYFDGIWQQAETDDQRHLLKTLAQRDTAWLLPDIATATGYSEAELTSLLRWAERHDMLQKQQGDAEPTWSFYVPLLRQWLAR